MRITDTNKSSSVGKNKKSDKKSGAADSGAFGSLLKTDGGSAASGAAGASPLQATTSIDALLALQEVGDATEDEKKNKAQQRAESILDRLEDIRVGLLTGVIQGDRLYQLKDIVNQQREQFTDPRLHDILDEIDLRARVEIAKLEVAQGK